MVINPNANIWLEFGIEFWAIKKLTMMWQHLQFEKKVLPNLLTLPINAIIEMVLAFGTIWILPNKFFFHSFFKIERRTSKLGTLFIIYLNSTQILRDISNFGAMGFDFGKYDCTIVQFGLTKIQRFSIT